ncbi:MAG: ribosome silencing factor [Oscillospiraceae bacterium]|nr:ribosome silencing factor [Oscillospiraceae bacterium]
MDSKKMALACAKAMEDKKGGEITVLKVRDLTVVTDYFVIATGTSTTQVKALAEEVEYQLDQAGIKVLRSEGYDSKSWILLDFGNVIVHVFEPSAREYYNLEKLWADGEKVELSDLEK